MSDFPYKAGKVYIFAVSPLWFPAKVKILDLTAETVLFENKDAGLSRRVLRAYFLENFRLIEEIA